MRGESEIICILCPMGCRVELTSDSNGNVISVAGNKCKLGEKYVIDEYKFPARILTATAITQSSKRKLLPIRSNRPIAKDKLLECMYHLPQVRIKPPVKTGQVVVANIANTGADLIATDDMLE